MKSRALEILVPAVLAAFGAALIAVWLARPSSGDLALRVPGLDRPEGARTLPVEPIEKPEPGQPVRSGVEPSTIAGSWPCFRGPDRDGICKDGVALADSWPESGPPVRWRREVGPGHAGVAVADGCAYLLDYDVEALADTMRCLSLDDGREIWRNSYPVEVPENHGMSRTVPAVWEDCVVSFGPKCHVACWDAKTGECRWLIDLVAEYGSKVPPWYAAQCPLVEEGRAILAPVGSAFMLAVDCRSGEIVWKTPKVRDWEMTHVSIAPVELAGRRMYVCCGSRGVAAVDAADGSLLWETRDWIGKMATCPTPVPVGGGRLFCSGGYGAGSVMLRMVQQGGQITAGAAFKLSSRQFGSEQQTPIPYEGHLYAVRTKPGAERLVCLDLEGSEVWNSGRDEYGRGPYLIADGKIYVMNDDGLLAMIEATPAGYRPLARFQVFEEAHDAWAPMALVAGRLILRDLTRMACLDVAKK